jgi:YidC/Oxa1 family membrane protein insertase
VRYRVLMLTVFVPALAGTASCDPCSGIASCEGDPLFGAGGIRAASSPYGNELIYLYIGGFIMAPLYYVISAVLLAFHRVFGNLFGDASGAAWVLSIVGLTLVIRAALIPLFVKQIKSSRNMQLIQPRVKELQKKYGHDRERLAQETMKLYRESGTNPFASCLPILLQMPIFLSLFRLIDQAAKHPEDVRGLMTTELNEQFGDAIFLSAKISDTFLSTDMISVRLLAAVLVIAMTVTTFLTQRQLMSKNMPADALSGPYAQQQKMLLYVLPLVFAVGGIAFPVCLGTRPKR